LTDVMWMAGTSWCSLPSMALMRSQSVKEGSLRKLRNRVTGQEAVALGQGTKMAVETEIIRGAVAAEAEKGMGAIGRETIVVTAEAPAEVQALTIKTAVEQGMTISAEAKAGAEVVAAHTIVLHLLGAVLALARARHLAGAQHHTAGAQHRTAGAQNHAAGALHHTTGAQNHTAGAQDDAAGAQHRTAGVQRHPAGMEVPESRPMEKVHLLHAVFHHHHSVLALVAQAAMTRSKACNEA